MVKRSRRDDLHTHTKQMKIVTTPTGHTITVNGLDWKGQERVNYDDELVAMGHSMKGGTYFFEVDEEGQDATYEVEFRVVGFWNTRAANVMRRNGVIFYSDK